MFLWWLRGGRGCCRGIDLDTSCLSISYCGHYRRHRRYFLGIFPDLQFFLVDSVQVVELVRDEHSGLLIRVYLSRTMVWASTPSYTVRCRIGSKALAGTVWCVRRCLPACAKKSPLHLEKNIRADRLNSQELSLPPGVGK